MFVLLIFNYKKPSLYHIIQIRVFLLYNGVMYNVLLEIGKYEEQIGSGKIINLIFGIFY